MPSQLLSQSCFYCPNFITAAPLWIKIKRLVRWLWANDITTIWGGVPNGTPSMMFIWCLNSIFLASLWLEINFQTGHFSDFEQFKAKIYFAKFGQVKIDPIWSVLLTLDRSVILLSLGKTCHEKQFKPSPFDKNSRTTHKIWFDCNAWAVLNVML